MVLVKPAYFVIASPQILRSEPETLVVYTVSGDSSASLIEVLV